jgi:hypothetical protein
MEVSIRDFRSNMASLIKDNEVIELTSNGKVIATVLRGVPSTIKTKKDAEKAVSERFAPTEFYGKYACGCAKGEKKLCPKHSRM